MIRDTSFNPGDLVHRVADGNSGKGTVGLLIALHKELEVKAWKVLADYGLTIWTQHNFAMYTKNQEIPRE